MDETAQPPRGTSLCRIDDKGRLKLPMDLVRFFGAYTEFFSTSLDGKTCRIYPATGWERVERELSQLDSEDAEAVLLYAHHLGGSSEIDGLSRVWISRELRDKLQISEQRVRLRWVKDHIEVYNEKVDESA